MPTKAQSPTRTGRTAAPKLAPIDPDEMEFIDVTLDEWDATDGARKVAKGNLLIFVRWLNATHKGVQLAEVTRDQCKEFLRHREALRPDGTRLAGSTVAKNWSDLRAFYLSAQNDLTDPLGGRTSPMAKVPMPKMPKYTMTHAASVAEVDRLLARFDLRTGLGLRNAAMVSVMFRSGPRVSEVGRLRLSDLDMEGRTIDLGLTKNDQPRRPTLHPETLSLLRKYLRRRGDHPGPLFESVHPRGAPLTTNAIQNIVKRAAATAKVPVTPHSLRRGFAVEYLTHGGDAATLMVLGGWESETMIVRYMGDKRHKTAQTVFDAVAQRQMQSRRSLRSVG